MSCLQERLAAAQKKVWEAQKRSRRYEDLFTEEAFEERKAMEESDDDFM
jgi:hypothetical protein